MVRNDTIRIEEVEGRLDERVAHDRIQRTYKGSGSVLGGGNNVTHSGLEYVLILGIESPVGLRSRSLARLEP